MLRTCTFSLRYSQVFSVLNVSSLRQITSKAHDPLRILFCGSDEFSITPLEALNSTRRALPSVISSIEVLCRSDKPTGRGYKGFREGPAPLHHTLLDDRKRTGVTLQTLHPTQFDGGRIIAQTPFPGIEHSANTVEDLRNLAARLGAQMLIQVIEESLFVPPIVEVGWCKDAEEYSVFKRAVKIGPEDRHLDWAQWTARDILRRQQIIGPLWNFTDASFNTRSGDRKESRRIIWEGGFRLEKDFHLFLPVGHPVIIGLHGHRQSVCVGTCDGNTLIAGNVKIEGERTADAFDAVRRTGLAPIPKAMDKLRQSPHDFVTFHSPLK
ncbi:MAG: hypothetical protein Q9222_000417 [Ikaeria aurantiellina]